jgi:O-antigen polymerase
MFGLKWVMLKKPALNILFAVFITLTIINIFITDLSIPNGVIDGKIIYFNIIAAGCIALCCLISCFLRPSTVQLNIIDICLLVFVLFVTTSYFAKFNFKNDYLISLLLCTCVFFIVKLNALDDTVYLIPLFKGVFLLTGFAQGVYGILQIAGITGSFHASFPVTGTFHNPAPFGIYMAIVFGYSTAEYLFYRPVSMLDKAFRIFSIANILIVLVVLPSADSRASWIAAIAALLFLLGVKYKTTITLSCRMKIALGVLVLCVMVAAGWFLFHYKLSSAQGRVAIWRLGLEMIRDNPGAGIGFNQFLYKYPAYQARFYNEHAIDGETINVVDKVDYVFNDYLQLTIENGIIGFLLFLSVIVFIFYSLKHNISRQAGMEGMYAAIIVILVSAVFSYSFQMVSILYIFLLLAAFVSAATKPVVSIRINSILGRIVISLVAAVCLIFVCNDSIKEYQLKHKWLYASSLMNNENYSNAALLYKEVYRGIPHEKTVLLEYGKCLLMAERYNEGVRILEQAAQYMDDPFLSINLAEGYSEQKRFGLAEKQLLMSIRMIPNRVYPRYLLTKLYLQQGDSLKASRLAEETLRVPVKVYSQAIMQMQSELKNIKKNN